MREKERDRERKTEKESGRKKKRKPILKVDIHLPTLDLERLPKNITERYRRRHLDNRLRFASEATMLSSVDMRFTILVRASLLKPDAPGLSRNLKEATRKATAMKKKSFAHTHIYTYTYIHFICSTTAKKQHPTSTKRQSRSPLKAYLNSRTTL